ncbi:MAG: hypothetical protein AABY85_00015 [Gemmatimonadota bacterium]
MNASRLAVLALAASLLGAMLPATLRAQNGERPRRGKVDEVERSRDRDSRGRNGNRGNDDDGDGGGWFIFRIIGHLICGCGDSDSHQADPPEPRAPTTGQGYLPHPYADRRARETFVLREVREGRTFGSVSGAYFRDDVSTLRAGHFALDGASGAAYGSLEYDYHREPKANETDYLHLWRAGVGAMPRLGRIGYLRVGVAARGVVLDDGDGAAGPELELGAKIFPLRPWAVSATGRVATLSWDGQSWFGFSQWAATASVFAGPVEIEGGAHWTRIGSAPAFYGPTLGARIWF